MTKAPADLVIEAVRGYVQRAMAPLLARIGDLEAALAAAPNAKALEDMIVRAVAAVPPERGEPGPSGKDGADGKAGVDGKDAVVDYDRIKSFVDDLTKTLAKISANAFHEALPVEVAKAIAEMPKPKDGIDGRDGRDAKDGRDGLPGRDAPELDILEAIDNGKGYPRGTYAKHRGGLWRAVKTTAPMLEGGAAEAGWTCIVAGVAEVAVEQGEDLRTFAIGVETSDGAAKAFTFAVPVVLDRGVYKPAAKYATGDSVSWDGSTWIAQKDIDSAGDRPGKPEWRLAVKRGSDGNSPRAPGLDNNAPLRIR